MVKPEPASRTSSKLSKLSKALCVEPPYDPESVDRVINSHLREMMATDTGKALLIYNSLVEARNHVDELRNRLRREFREMRKYGTAEGIRAAELERSHLDITASTLSSMVHQLAMLWEESTIKGVTKFRISDYVPKAVMADVHGVCSDPQRAPDESKNQSKIRPGSKKHRIWMTVQRELQTGPKSLDDLLAAALRIPGIFDDVRDPRGNLSNLLSQLRGMGLLTAESRGIWALT